MPRVTLWIDEEDLEAVRALAEERGLTLDDVAQELLMRKLRREVSSEPRRMVPRAQAAFASEHERLLALARSWEEAEANGAALTDAAAFAVAQGVDPSTLQRALRYASAPEGVHRLVQEGKLTPAHVLEAVLLLDCKEDQVALARELARTNLPLEGSIRLARLWARNPMEFQLRCPLCRVRLLPQTGRRGPRARVRAAVQRHLNTAHTHLGPRQRSLLADHAWELLEGRRPRRKEPERERDARLDHIRRVYEAHHRVLSAIVRGEYRGSVDAPLRFRER